MGGWYLRMAEAVEACMSSCTRPERPHRPYWQLQCSGSVRSVRNCADLCGQKCSSKPDQISNHRVMGSNPGSAIPSWLRVRTVLGSIGEELALAICHSGWAKPAVSKVCLGSMRSHFPVARKKISKASEVKTKKKSALIFILLCVLAFLHHNKNLFHCLLYTIQLEEEM